MAAVIIGLFIVALAYLEYHRFFKVDWVKVQSFSQSGIMRVTDTITLISNTIGAHHSETFWPFGIPLASSVSAGLMLGLAKG